LHDEGKTGYHGITYYEKKAVLDIKSR
jgi:hypothetical protein